MSNFWRNKRICVTGGAGFLGRAVCRLLRERGASDPFVPRSTEYDLTTSESVERLMQDAKPDVVLHLAAEVGGIGANQKRPGRFFYANLAMGMHLTEAARRHNIQKFVQIGTVCGYPKHCPAPFKEEDLWSGYPEETNAPYGVTKRALSVMLESYRAEYGLCGLYLLPVNMYGPHDNFDLETSHVIPALIRKFAAAVANGTGEVVCWGTGRASREFLYVDDAAEGIVLATETLENPEPINLGTGREITIADLASLIAKMVGFDGRIIWDTSRPDGQPRRQLDTARARDRFGWVAKTSLEDGLRRTIAWWRVQAESPLIKCSSH